LEFECKAALLLPKEQKMEVGENEFANFLIIFCQKKKAYL